MENDEVEKYEFHDETSDDLIPDKNLNIFTQTLITIFHIQQWTQVSCQFIKMIQNTSLMMRMILPNTAAVY